MMSDLTATYDEEKDLARQPVRQARQGVRGLEHQADGSGAMYRNKAEVTNLASSQDDVVVLYAQWEDAMTVMPEDGRNSERPSHAENHLGGGLPLRPRPHPIRAAAHAPKPVASAGRAV